MIWFSALAWRSAPLLAMIALVGGCCDGFSYIPPGTPPTATPTLQPTPTPACALAFTNPSAGAALIANGPVDFTWTSIANAAFYLLTLDVPGGVDKTTFTVHGNKRTLYMESFQVGSFSAQVQARNADNDILCQASLQFSTQPPDPKAKKDGGSGPGALPPPVFNLPPPPQ